jgi:hypothetical protein
MYGSLRNGGVPLFTGSADGPDYWNDLAARHAQHRRHVRNLLVVMVVVVVLAAAVDVNMLGVAALVGPLLVLELWMVRRSRPTSRIPDYRAPDRVEIELDEPA